MPYHNLADDSLNYDSDKTYNVKRWWHQSQSWWQTGDRVHNCTSFIDRGAQSFPTEPDWVHWGPKLVHLKKLHHLNRDRCTKSRLHKSRRHKSLGKSFMVTNCRWAVVKLTHCSWLWSEGGLTKCLRWSQIWGTFERAGNCFWTTTIFEAWLELRFNDMLSSSVLQRTKPRPQPCYGSQHLG